MASLSSSSKKGSSSSQVPHVPAAVTPENFQHRPLHSHSDAQSKKSEKKKLWRQSLSEEQLRKMRERDAERKREE
eukprot:IDg21104t1